MPRRRGARRSRPPWNRGTRSSGRPCMAEQIRFPIVGEDRGATRVLKDVGRESAVMAAQTRVLAESLDKQKRASTAATDALLKVEKAATLVAITERALAAE